MSKKIVYKLITIAVIIPVAAPVMATAQSAPANPPAGGSFEQRLNQRKAERTVTLDEKSQKRLTGTCVGAQSKLRGLQQSTTAAANNRARVYQQMDAKLWVAIGKLKIAQKDTFELEKQRAELAAKTTAFQASAKNYQQTIDDLLVINCQADPAGFKALVDTARIYRNQLREQSADIRNYVVNTVKPTVSGFAAELQAKPGREGDN